MVASLHYNNVSHKPHGKIKHYTYMNTHTPSGFPEAIIADSPSPGLWLTLTVTVFCAWCFLLVNGFGVWQASGTQLQHNTIRTSLSLFPLMFVWLLCLLHASVLRFRWLSLPLSPLSPYFSYPVSGCCCLITQTQKLQTSMGETIYNHWWLDQPSVMFMSFCILSLSLCVSEEELGVVLDDMTWQHGFLTLPQIN